MAAGSANPLPYVYKREYGDISNIKSNFFNKRLAVAKNLYRRDLLCHFGCVNAIEFSSNGELLVSGMSFHIYSNYFPVDGMLILITYYINGNISKTGET